MKKYLFFILLFLLYNNSYSQNGWFIYNDFSDILSVKFYDANIGWAAGRNGMIVKTNDGGINWIYQANPAFWSINSLSVINQNICIAVGDAGTVLRTSDGGAHWLSITVNNNYDNNAVYFFDQNNGWIATDSSILRTTDSGVNWFSVTSLTSSFYNMKFFSVNNGIAINRNGMFCRTTNGGVNWTVSSFPYPGMKYFSFLNESTGFCTGNMRVLKTTDGGSNWISVYTTNADWCGLDFLNANTGFGATTGRKIFKTTDGGYNWFEKFPGDSGYMVTNNFAILNSGNIISCGYNRRILKSTDEGNTWNYVFKNSMEVHSIYDLSFPDDNTGYLLSNLSKLYKTTNNGYNWNALSIVNLSNSASLWFINVNTGFIATSSYFSNSTSFQKTTNGGLNWTPFTDMYHVQTNALYFINENTGWVGGEYVNHPSGVTQGVTYKTTNAGLNWTPSNYFNYDITVTKVYFQNEVTGWVVYHEITASGGGVLRTTNGGVSYAGIFSSNPPPSSVGFADSVTGFIVGGPNISKTTNCGVNWAVTSYPGKNFFDVKFVNENTGWIIGSTKTLLKTTNKGQNWLSYELSPGSVLWKLKFYNENTGYILDYSGSIYKTTNGGVSFVRNNENTTPGDYYLRQNYPNPFNNSTRIIFGVKNSALCKIKVYDITGRLVSELFNEIVEPGEISINFNSSNLASGIYFCTLELINAGNGMMIRKLTNKMVVVK